MLFPSKLNFAFCFWLSHFPSVPRAGATFKSNLLGYFQLEIRRGEVGGEREADVKRQNPSESAVCTHGGRLGLPDGFILIFGMFWGLAGTSVQLSVWQGVMSFFGWRCRKSVVISDSTWEIHGEICQGV